MFATQDTRIERFVVRDDGKHIFTRDIPGPEPALVLMHGFPDAIELYDRLLPHLLGRRRVVLFDFVGWGRSDKGEGITYSFEHLKHDLQTVVDELGLEQPDLVAHDASGPPAIEWAVEHPERVGNLILLNSFYMMMLQLRPPEGVLLYMLPGVKYAFRLLNQLSRGRFNQHLYRWQLRRFIRDTDVKDSVVPALYASWASSWPAFRDLVGSLFWYSISRARRVHMDRLRAYTGRVRVIFGACDPYLNAHVARRFAREFPRSDLFLLDSAYHYVQVDEPATVAQLILGLR
jgi:haloalkane dehalogenase